MSLSNKMKESIAKHRGGIIPIQLVEISHPSFDTIRLAQYNKDVTHQGNVYTAWAIQDPNFFGDQVASAFPSPVLTLDNIDQRITAAIETSDSSRTKPTVIRKLVSNYNTEVIERQAKFFASDYSYVAKRLVLNLTLLQYDAGAIPAVAIDPTTFPGAFSNLK